MTAADDRAAFIERIDALLPQTQCRRCGYAGCAPYAAAIVGEGASIALCPPGGTATYSALAQALGEARGGPPPVDEAPCVAVIVEADCIGCTRCIEACPVDAIAGAVSCMHTVVAAWCTGCALCAPVCPTNCIEMHAPAAADIAAPEVRARAARTRYVLTGTRRARAPVAGSALVEVANASAAELRAAVLAAVRRRQAAKSSTDTAGN